ncbi:MAG: hypothetical protein AB7G06_07685 [Bdellovibrionales bacterium]
MAVAKKKAPMKTSVSFRDRAKPQRIAKICAKDAVWMDALAKKMLAHRAADRAQVIKDMGPLRPSEPRSLGLTNRLNKQAKGQIAGLQAVVAGLRGEGYGVQVHIFDRANLITISKDKKEALFSFTETGESEKGNWVTIFELHNGLVLDNEAGGKGIARLELSETDKFKCRDLLRSTLKKGLRSQPSGGPARK